MVHIAKLVSVCSVDKVPEHIKPFIHFHAQLEGIEPDTSEKVAILQVEGTQSFAEARNLLLQYLK
jgi:hypothetical protein